MGGIIFVFRLHLNLQPLFLRFFLFCLSLDYLEGTRGEEREDECRTRVFRPGGAWRGKSTFYRWSSTRACLPRRWQEFFIEKRSHFSCTYNYFVHDIFFLLFFLSTDNGLSVPSDASLSPASQNSPYSITPVSQGSPASSGIGSPMASNAITKIHSRRFRE